MTEPFRLAYVEGATPARWIRAWDERMPRRLEHRMVEAEEQESLLREGAVDAALVRLPIDAEGMHVVRLYDELAVAVVALEHPAASDASVALADLDDEPMLERGSMTWRELVEVAASGAGVATMPMSIARLHRRRDAVAVPLSDVEPTTIALAWLRARDGDDVQALVGIVRGRSARSSR